MGVNHKVAFKDETTIAAIAARCWTLSRQQRPLTFDIVRFINDVLIAKGIDTVVPTRGRKKGKLTLKFFDRQFAQDDPAYVEFARDQRDNYVTLYVDHQIWNLANRGDSDACEVLAHEVGHILLHNHYANAFSTDGNNQKIFEGTSKEDFAEWQAITFAGYLLVPPHAVEKFGETAMLATATNVPERLAAERIAATRSQKKVLARKYEGDICGCCFNFTLVQNGLTTKCDTCGNVERA